MEIVVEASQYGGWETDIFDMEEASNQMLWFYEQGQAPSQKGKKVSKRAKQAFSFLYDAPYIYAAFLDQYGIDLQEVGLLHWWKFKAMFDSFKDDLLISQIMKYRVIDTAGMDKETASFYRKMRKAYALPKEVSGEEQKELDALNKALIVSYIRQGCYSICYFIGASASSGGTGSPKTLLLYRRGVRQFNSDGEDK